jgi:hypothetical protein
LCVGYVDENSERPGRALRNSAAVLQNGKIVWRTHKSLLPTCDVFDEDRYFEPAKSVVPFEFNSEGVRSKLGITICEDIWNDEDFWPEWFYRRNPIKELIAQGAEIIRLGFDVAVVNDVINKVTFSEYKRRQAAPGLRVSPRAFGMGRRIPIAQKFRPRNDTQPEAN